MPTPSLQQTMMIAAIQTIMTTVQPFTVHPIPHIRIRALHSHGLGSLQHRYELLRYHAIDAHRSLGVALFLAQADHPNPLRRIVQASCLTPKSIGV